MAVFVATENGNEYDLPVPSAFYRITEGAYYRRGSSWQPRTYRIRAWEKGKWHYIAQVAKRDDCFKEIADFERERELEYV